MKEGAELNITLRLPDGRLMMQRMTLAQVMVQMDEAEARQALSKLEEFFFKEFNTRMVR